MTRSIKLNKKIFAAFMTVIIALGIFNLTALAETTGTISIKVTGERGDRDIEYKYKDIGQTCVEASGENSTLITEGDNSYTVEFSPAVGASVSFEIYNIFTDEVAISIGIPKSSTGMPATLRTYVSMPAGYYSVRVVSKSDATAFGSVSILGVLDAVNIIIDKNTF